MKKIVCLCFLFLLLVGCTKKEPIKEEAKSIIETKNDTVIALNYPQFGNSKLDLKVESLVNQIYQDFQSEYTNKGSFNGKSELNIDYSYNLLNNRYLNLVLTKFINTSNLESPIYEVYTYHYDKEKKELFSLQDLILKEELIKLVPMIKKKLVEKYKNKIDIATLHSLITDDFSSYQNFTFNEDDLIFYFHSKGLTKKEHDIITISISLDQVNLKIPFERGVFQEKKYKKITPVKKVLDPEKKAVAFTFDDGPSSYTKEIAKILKAHQASATFFVIGNKVELYQDLLRNLVQEGHELGNHSYNHKWLTRVTDDELLRQISDTQNIIQKVTGVTPTLFRPTYGSINKHLRDQVNLNIVMWSVDTSDWKTRNPKTIAKRSLKQIHDGDVILMHDNHKQTVEALDLILEELEKEDYQFVTVSELNEIDFIRRSK